MAGRKKKEMGGKKVGQIGARMFKWKKKSLFDYCTIWPNKKHNNNAVLGTKGLY